MVETLRTGLDAVFLHRRRDILYPSSDLANVSPSFCLNCRQICVASVKRLLSQPLQTLLCRKGLYEVDEAEENKKESASETTNSQLA